MKEINSDELKTIQLDILSAVDVFCTEHNIKYSLADGTLLGAVRHGGYIPWDDDIDIVMLRDDYEKFEKEFPPIYKDHYRLASIYREKQWFRAYPNVYDDRTVFKEKALGGEHGVSIDIFPVDDVPDELNQWKSYYSKLKILFNVLTIKTLVWNKNRPLKNNLLMVLLKCAICWLPIRSLVYLCDKYAKYNNGKGYSCVYECCFGAYGLKAIRKSIFENIVDINFEGRQFKAFADSREFLTQTYGDYMQLPPEEERISHHEFKAYWK